MFSRHKTPRSPLQIGLQKTENHYHCLWFDQHDRAQSTVLTPPLSLAKLRAAMGHIAQERRNNLSFIISIPGLYVWTQSMLLPHHLSPAESEQQCRFLLQNALPTPVDNIWFDYVATPLTQGIRLDIFAVRQDIAEKYIRQYSPLPISILDSNINAIVRAFLYLLDETVDDDALFIYQDEQINLAIQQTAQQANVTQQIDQNLTALYDQFCQSYRRRPRSVYVYSHLTPVQPFPAHWQVINTDLPLIALGNALWRRDLPQITQ
ncbi:hypothetical protein [Necropsobacter massiliensis]|uniref:hypothetical protein n=1 Tax=Necropsobacter massiliensis TaxID=1400001 RepID=UPI000660DDAC|nr:hypothetical protein [Necropsobacter massiliensis]